MAVLDIARMGNPVLAQRAAEVADPTAPEIRQLVANMLETMEYAGGTGLAAPQVHVPLRVVLFYVEATRAARENDPAGVDGTPDGAAGDDGGRAVLLTVLINPEIEILDPQRMTDMRRLTFAAELERQARRAPVEV